MLRRTWCAAGAEGRAAATRRGTFSRSAPVFAAAAIGGAAASPPSAAEGSVAPLAGKVASAVEAPGHPEAGSGAIAAAIGLNVRASGEAGSLRIVSILTTSAAGNPPTFIPSTATSLCDAPCQPVDPLVSMRCQTKGGVLPSWSPCRLFLGPGFRLGACWNRLVEAVKTRKKREKTGGEWARYGPRSVNKEGTGRITWGPLADLFERFRDASG